ncbi:MAG: flagellar hook-length control protein FliK [Vitreoscilla sp.]|nr:flagellar hook-length control protein FliK [Vitreoscilla sp.]
MSTAAPVTPAHATAPRPAQPAARPATPGGAGGAFAQWLQQAADDDAASGSALDTGAPETDGAEGAADACEARAADRKRAEARDAADDAMPSAPLPDTTPPTPAAPRDLLGALRRAGLQAAAKAHARADGGPGDAAADAINQAADRAAARPDPAGAEARFGADNSALNPGLDALPVNLAPVQATAAAEGVLPSLAAAGEAPAAPAPTPAPAAAPPALASLAAPPGSPAFPAALGAQLQTWLRDGVQYASLELNPRDMGPIDVRIALRDGVTQVELAADVQATREALAEALPALAESLGDVGLSLAGGSVSDQTGQHAREGDAQAQRAFALPAWLAPGRDPADASAATPRPASRGLIDLVA